MEMVERLLLDGIDAETGTSPVGGEHHSAICHAAYEAGAALSFVQLAVARTEVTLDTAIVQHVPESGRMTFVNADGFIHFILRGWSRVASRPP